MSATYVKFPTLKEISSDAIVDPPSIKLTVILYVVPSVVEIANGLVALLVVVPFTITSTVSLPDVLVVAHSTFTFVVPGAITELFEGVEMLIVDVGA